MTVCDRRPGHTDAVFVHGSPAMSDEIDQLLLKEAVTMVRSGQARDLVINGLTDEQCWPNGQRLAYPGSDTWRRWLNELGYPSPILTSAAPHTAAESDAVIALARERGWSTVTIMSYPHHILRCMLQMVFCLERARSPLKVYTRTIIGKIDWLAVLEKGVLNSVPFRGVLGDVHIEQELARVEKYADKDGTGYTPHATLEELIAYFGQRDRAA